MYSSGETSAPYFFSFEEEVPDSIDEIGEEGVELSSVLFTPALDLHYIVLFQRHYKGLLQLFLVYVLTVLVTLRVEGHCHGNHNHLLLFPLTVLHQKHQLQPSEQSSLNFIKNSQSRVVGSLVTPSISLA